MMIINLVIFVQRLLIWHKFIYWEKFKRKMHFALIYHKWVAKNFILSTFWSWIIHLGKKIGSSGVVSRDSVETTSKIWILNYEENSKLDEFLSLSSHLSPLNGGAILWYPFFLVLTSLSCHVDKDCIHVKNSICHPGAGFCACPGGTTYVAQEHACRKIYSIPSRLKIYHE